MKVTLEHWETAWGEGEHAAVFVDGAAVGSLSTCTDCPEDNTITRMGVLTLLEKLAFALGANEVATIYTKEEND